MSVENFGHYHAQVPRLSSHIYQVDSFKVASAKAAHFAAHDEVLAHSGHRSYFTPAVPAAYGERHQTGYIPSFDYNGYQPDTPEVVHLAELSKAREHHTTPNVVSPYTHSYPAAYSHTGHYIHGAIAYDYPDVTPLDTAVNQVKVVHAAAHAQAYARA